MRENGPIHDPIAAIGLLAEPNRLRLYEFVVGRHASVGRDEAAQALGMPRELVAFHLDRLVEGGLLETEYRRLSGRTGPGAGRPAKLYRASPREISVTLPTRNYLRGADLWAKALSSLPGGSGLDAVSEVARERGREAGLQARLDSASPRSRPGLLASLLGLLRRAGYDPEADASGTVMLRNCPFEALAEAYRPLTCGMNVAWAEGVLEGIGQQGITVLLAPEPGRCCLIFRE